MSGRLGKIVYRASSRKAVFAESKRAIFSTATPVINSEEKRRTQTSLNRLGTSSVLEEPRNSAIEDGKSSNWMRQGVTSGSEGRGRRDRRDAHIRRSRDRGKNRTHCPHTGVEMQKAA